MRRGSILKGVFSGTLCPLAPCDRDRDPEHLREYADANDLDGLLAATRRHFVRLSDTRVTLPAETPHISGHNQWVANRPGTTLFAPVVDLSQQAFSILAVHAQAGSPLYDTAQGRLLGEPGPLLR